MIDFLKRNILSLVTLILGGAGLALRLVLNGAVDDKGFVPRWHWSTVALLLLTLALLALLFAAARTLRQAAKYSFNFPPSLAGALGTVLAAVGFGVTSVTELLASPSVLELICALLGLLTAAALLPVALCRWRGDHPSMLLHGLSCAYLMVRLICMYRHWSSDPQLTDYAFELLALVSAMLAVYHRATFDADFGQRSAYAFFSLAAVYFCLLCLGGSEPMLFGAMGLWLLTDRCDMTPMPRAYREGRL